MPVPGVIAREGERAPAGGRTPGDVSRGLFVGAALRGPADRPIEIKSPVEIATLLGDPYGGSHLHRALTTFFADGGSEAIVVRAVDATAAPATADLDGTTGGAALSFTADGPGAWGNALKLKAAAGTGGRTKITVTEAGISRLSIEVASADEAAQRLTTVGLVKVKSGPGQWPPKVTTTDVALVGGVSADSAVTDANVVTAIGKLPLDVPGTRLAPGHTSLDVHQALLDSARAVGGFAALDLPNITDVPTLAGQLATLRAYGTEKPGRYGMPLIGWPRVPLGGVLSVSVPPSAMVAGLLARGDASDPQKQARIAAGPEYTSRVATGVTQTFTAAEWEILAAAGGNLIRQEPEGVCLMGARTVVDGERWPQYTFAAGARVRMAIVDKARAAVRPFLFRALDGEGVTLETIRGTVEGVCEPYSQAPIYGLYDHDGDHGYSVTIVSTEAELAQGKVRVQLALRTSPTIEQVVIEFTAVAIGDTV